MSTTWSPLPATSRSDSVFEGDPDRNFGRDPLIISRELVRPVTLTGDLKAVEADVKFELVLDRL